MVPTESVKSALIQKVEHYLQLTAQERNLLSQLETSPRQYSRNTEVVSSGSPADQLFVVQSGWLISYTLLPDGRRQVLQIHFPGDICGLSDLPFAQTTHEVKTLTDCTLSAFPRDALDPIFRGSARLTAVMFSMVMIDQAIYMDRLRVMGRMNARERVIHFLLSTLSRLRVLSPGLGTVFDFPLTQTDLADAVGLTNVSVSNALGMLQEKGVLKRSGGRIHVLNEAYMRETANFIDRYGELDISWFPERA